MIRAPSMKLVVGRAKARSTSVAPGFARGCGLRPEVWPRRRPLQTHLVAAAFAAAFHVRRRVPRAKPGATFIERAFARNASRPARCGLALPCRAEAVGLPHALDHDHVRPRASLA